MNDPLTCPYCGALMDYAGPDDSLVCICCFYIIRGDGSEDFSAMNYDDLEIQMNF